jgi:hypothetical protein
MLTIRAHFDGRAIIPDEPVDLPTGKALEVTVKDPQTSPKGSPSALLHAMSEMPRLTQADLDALAESIEAGKLPVTNSGIFDEPGK